MLLDNLRQPNSRWCPGGADERRRRDGADAAALWRYLGMQSLTNDQQEQIVSAAGNAESTKRLAESLYRELRSLAGHHLRRERSYHTLQMTALANEAYLRLCRQDISWAGRTHFLGMAAEMIRRVLVDHARKRNTVKRGRDMHRVTNDQQFLDLPAKATIDLLELETALGELGEMSPRQAKVVELRFFGNLSIEETATLLSVSPRTVKGDWRVARAWLRQRLS
ncbi:MAG: ECF-type sigma factor [Planctomycetota bacterium]